MQPLFPLLRALDEMYPTDIKLVGTTRLTPNDLPLLQDAGRVEGVEFRMFVQGFRGVQRLEDRMVNQRIHYPPQMKTVQWSCSLGTVEISLTQRAITVRSTRREIMDLCQQEGGRLGYEVTMVMPNPNVMENNEIMD